MTTPQDKAGQADRELALRIAKEVFAGRIYMEGLVTEYAARLKAAWLEQYGKGFEEWAGKPSSSREEEIYRWKKAGWIACSANTNWIAENMQDKIDLLYSLAGPSGRTLKELEIINEELSEQNDYLRADNDRLKEDYISQCDGAASREPEIQALREEVERLKGNEEGYPGIAHDFEAAKLALQNCRLLAARNRKEPWALLILGFCAEGGVVSGITRESEFGDAHGPDWTDRDGEYLK